MMVAFPDTTSTRLWLFKQKDPTLTFTGVSNCPPVRMPDPVVPLPDPSWVKPPPPGLEIPIWTVILLPTAFVQKSAVQVPAV